MRVARGRAAVRRRGWRHSIRHLGRDVIERSSGDCSARALERVNTSIAQPFRAGRGRNRRDDAPAARTLAALGTRDDDLDADRHAPSRSNDACETMNSIARSSR